MDHDPAADAIHGGRARLEAVIRLLEGSGDITPQGARLIREVRDDWGVPSVLDQKRTELGEAEFARQYPEIARRARQQPGSHRDHSWCEKDPRAGHEPDSVTGRQ